MKINDAKIPILILTLLVIQVATAEIGELNLVAENALVEDHAPQSGIWIPDGDYIESCLPQSTTSGEPYCVRNHVSEYRKCRVRQITSLGHIALLCGDPT